jgi:hypothetical protein
MKVTYKDNDMNVLEIWLTRKEYANLNPHTRDYLWDDGVFEELLELTIGIGVDDALGL